MRIAFLNPQGNFDPTDRGWTEHPDFGGQLVYVKELSLALGELNCKVDILTRQIIDPNWPEFAATFDNYPGHHNIRIIRLPCGPDHLLPKEELWPWIREWVENIIRFYQNEGQFPVAATSHYGDGGLAAALLQERLGTLFTFTAHSLGAQKMDQFLKSRESLSQLLQRFHFDKRIAAERLSMARASRIITSTRQERFEQYKHQIYAGAVDPQDDQKFAVIPPGVNLRLFGIDQKDEFEERIAEKVEAMLKRDIPESRCHLPVVICSSRLDRKKNHVALLRAWQVNQRLRDSANLALVVNDHPDPLRQRNSFYSGEKLSILNQIVEILEKANLWPCVTAFDLKNQKELAAAYRYFAKNRRGIFALTSVYEPFGLAPLEAMACGLPAVVTKNGGPSESLQDEKTEYGILVDPNDPADIGNGLTRLTLDLREWRLMQQAGIHRVNEKHTWEKAAESYLVEIHAILAGEVASQRTYPIPNYFKNPENNDIDEEWLKKHLP
ncbi:MAG: glycosyltransferase [bacterium]